MGRLDIMMDRELERRQKAKLELERRQKANDDAYTPGIEGQSSTDVKALKIGRRNQPTADANTDDQYIDIYKDYDMYLAAKKGDLDDFSRILDRVSGDENSSIGDVLCSRISPTGNTLLHVAAKHGSYNIVTYILEKDSSLVTKKNSNGDTALHLAAEFGVELAVKALVRNQTEEADRESLLRAHNEQGNTALHQAIINNRSSIAEYLIEEDSELLYYSNNRGECVLYLASKVCFVDCVASILKFSTDHERINDQFKKKSPIEAAILNDNLVIVQLILSRDRSFIKFKDDQGKTPLHHAAESGCLKMVRYLINIHAPNAPQRDNNGLFPIHLATIRGHIDIISLFLQPFIDPRELVDLDGHNILHIAAKSGRCNVVRYILDNPDLMTLINMKNKYGNVPLHLATINWHPTIVSVLTWDKRVDVTSVNDDGLTALDAAEDQLEYNASFRQRLTWSALKSAGTPRSPSKKSILKKSSKSSNGENYKERVNTLLLVATLVATITFAAGFTLPGGYSTSDKDLGMAAMLRSTGFHIFVFCDTIAMYSSILVAVSLVWAQFGDLNLVLIALNLAMPLLGISLTMMPMAFTAGMYLVVSKLGWLSIAVLVMGLCFFTMLLVLLLPLCMRLTSSNTSLRYLSYYPFCLLILATRSYSEDKLN